MSTEKTEKQRAAEAHAAERRADHLRALKEERAGYVQRGLDDRVAQVDAEIERLEGKPTGRRAAGKSDA